MSEKLQTSGQPRFVKGRSVEDVSRRTANTKTYKNPDGSFTAEISSSPRHFKVGDAWHEIDNTLIGDVAGGLRNRANSFVVRFRSSGVRLETPEGTVTMAPLSGRLSEPVVSADQQSVTYADVWPGIDVRYRVVNTGVKEELVLRSLPAVSQFSFRVHGTSLALQPDGSLRAAGAFAGKWKVSAPVVFDKEGAPVPAAAPTFTVQDTKVSLTVDREWLEGLQTSDLPVVIDPTWGQIGLGADHSNEFFGQPDGQGGQTIVSECWDCQVSVGRPSSDGVPMVPTWRSAVYFPYLDADIEGYQLMRASVLLQSRTAGTDDPYNIKVYGGDVNGSYGGDNDWIHLGQYLGEGSSSTTFPFTSPGLTTYYRDRINSGIAGLPIKFVGDESWNNTYKRFAFFALYLDYDRPPFAGLLASPTPGTVVTTLTPTLQGNEGADQDNDPLKYRFQVSVTDDPNVGVVWDSGYFSETPPMKIVPPGLLNDGVTYSWKMYTTDDINPPVGSLPWTFKVNLRLGDQGVNAFDTIGPVRVNLGTGNVVVDVDSPTFNTVGGPLGISMTYNSMPPGPFTLSGAPLPAGWTLSTEAARGVAYSHLRVGADTVVAVDSSGAPHEYRRGTAGSPGFTAATAADSGVMAHNPSGEYTLLDGGVTYVFSSSGRLTSATMGRDDAAVGRSSPTYSFAGPTLNPSSMTDPVSGRSITFTYGSACPAPPAPFVALPANSTLLCRVTYWDGTTTNLYYNAAQQLVRIVDPGSASAGYPATDFVYEASGRLTRVRTPLAYDAIAAGVRSDDINAWTVISYDQSTGWAASVALPKALATDANRPSNTYRYLSGVTDCGVALPQTCTKVDTAGLAPATGWARRVVLSASKQILSDTDATGKATAFQWDGADRLVTTTDPAGRKTTTIFDDATNYGATVRATGNWGPPTTLYGPAPSNCFTGLVPNGSCNPPVPKTMTAYDGAATFADNTTTTGSSGIWGLAASFWNNSSFSGAPASFATRTTINQNGGSNAPPSSARYTGEILLPNAGNYTFNVTSDDGVRLFIDDKPVIDNWYCCGGFSGTLNGAAAGRHRIRLDYFNAGGPAYLTLSWSGPGVSGVVPMSNLFPRYDLTTATVDADGKKTSTSYNQSFAHPEHGLPTVHEVDPTGSTPLSSSIVYPLATGFFRPQRRGLPGGNDTSYVYYGNTSAPTNPCGGTAINQGGALQTRTSPDGRVEEFYYDQVGRPIGSRTGSEPWTCTTYDGRGRPLTTTIPAISGYSGGARTVTSVWKVANNPLVITVTDTTSGLSTVTTTVDLLGRVVSYTDALGLTTTSTYDLAGRPTDVVGPAGGPAGRTQHFGYDDAGRLTSETLDGSVVATLTYNATNGELQSIAYPSGAGKAGNGTSLSSIGRDNSGATTALTWSLNGATSSDAVTRSPAGRVTDQTIDGVDPHAGPNFVYDSAGRLTDAWITGHHLTYGFAASGGCGTLTTAGKNSNRTSVTDDNGPDSTYCYDQGDRLTSTTDSRYTGSITYDSHNNTTALGSETMTYDASDRNMSITNAGTTVNYTRDATDRIVARTVPSGSSTPISVRGWSSRGNTVATTVVLDKPTAPNPVAADDILVAGIATRGGSNVVVTPPDSTWYPIESDDNSTSLKLVSFWHRATASEPATYTFTINVAGSNPLTPIAKAAAGTLTAYAGVDPIEPIDNADTYESPDSLSIVAPSIITEYPNARIVGIFTIATKNPIDPPPGMTERGEAASNVSGQAHVSVETADEQQAIPGPTGTKVAQVTSGSSARTNGHTIALKPANVQASSSSTFYGYSDDSDSPMVVLDGNRNIVQRTIPLPGGVILTKQSTGDVWSYPNIHGDIVATANASGTRSGTMTYDPYGQALGSVPDNISGDFDYGWAGADQRPYEHEGDVGVIQMGARPYTPALGRFIQPDAFEGGSANSYEYCVADPLNCSDLSGNFIISAEAARRWAMALGAVEKGADLAGRSEIPYAEIPAAVLKAGTMLIDPEELYAAAESAKRRAKRKSKGKSIKYDPYVEVWWGSWELPLIHVTVPDPKARFRTVLKRRQRTRHGYSRF